MSEAEGGGEKIGRYSLGEVVGEGAMAMVYKALDPEIGRTVAIKILKDEWCVDEEYLGRFLREARASGALSHSNIVTIFDVGRAGKKPYITMELLEGDTLEDVMNSDTKLSMKEVLSIGIDLAKALDYAHTKGIVHRDIKPGNIIFTPGSMKVKIADFGIARIENTDEVNKTQAGMVLGTPRYMSPEQARGKPADGRSDLFSLGVILYELVSGKKAFDATTMTSLLYQITQEDPVPIKKVDPKIPVGMRKIVTKLLEKKPSKRFQTGNELSLALIRELDAVIEHEQEAERNRFIPLKLKWAVTMGAVVVAVLLVAMSTVYRIQSREITEQVIDSGSSLANFIAAEAAISVLSEDWIRLETFVDEAGRRQSISYLMVADHTGVIRAATDKLMIGSTYTQRDGSTPLYAQEDFSVSTRLLDDGTGIFDFATPVLFQDTKVGQIYLGLSREGLDGVMETTRLLMVLLGAVTVLAASGMLYVFGGLLASPFSTLRSAMKVVGKGDFDYRISSERNDEIGELFEAFNAMAQSLHRVGEKIEKKALAQQLEDDKAAKDNESEDSEVWSDQATADDDSTRISADAGGAGGS